MTLIGVFLLMAYGAVCFCAGFLVARETPPAPSAEGGWRTVPQRAPPRQPPPNTASQRPIEVRIVREMGASSQGDGGGS